MPALLGAVMKMGGLWTCCFLCVAIIFCSNGCALVGGICVGVGTILVTFSSSTCSHAFEAYLVPFVLSLTSSMLSMAYGDLWRSTQKPP